MRVRLLFAALIVVASAAVARLAYDTAIASIARATPPPPAPRFRFLPDAYLDRDYEVSLHAWGLRGDDVQGALPAGMACVDGHIIGRPVSLGLYRIPVAHEGNDAPPFVLRVVRLEDQLRTICYVSAS